MTNIYFEMIIYPDRDVGLSFKFKIARFENIDDFILLWLDNHENSKIIIQRYKEETIE